MSKSSLQALRTLVKEKEAAMVRLLNERASLAVEIGRLKRLEGWEIYDPARESHVYRCLEEMNEGPLPTSLSGRSTVRSSRRPGPSRRPLPWPSSVPRLPSATGGPPALRQGALLRPQATIAAVFDAVERERQVGVSFPSKTPPRGPSNRPWTACSPRADDPGGGLRRIRHCLVSGGEETDRIERVYSHPQPWPSAGAGSGGTCPVRCSWRRKHGHGRAEGSGRPAGAAIASRLAADAGELRLLAEGIEDSPLNTTPFLDLGRRERRKRPPPYRRAATRPPSSSGRPTGPGAPRGPRALCGGGGEPDRIESYPARDRMWEYLFFAICRTPGGGQAEEVPGRTGEADRFF